MPVVRRAIRLAAVAALGVSACCHAIADDVVPPWDPRPAGTISPHRLVLPDLNVIEVQQEMPLRPAETAQAQPAPSPAPPPAAAPPDQSGQRPKVDESALRYFARQGDTKRLEAEIARLKALYPDWTPPADPLAVPVNVDEKLEAVWALYAAGKYAEARRAIAQRRTDEPGWTPPPDLLERLAVAEAREQLVNASNLHQYDTVIRIGSGHPSLLTCSEVDVLWRVAEAFAETQRANRARDAYRYILTNCDDTQERLATAQNAVRLLPSEMADELLALERFDAAGAGEFAPVRDDLARKSVAAGGADPAVDASPEQLARVEKLTTAEGKASDSLLLGWYNLRHGQSEAAEKWFRAASGIEDSAEASQGLSLVLVARKAFEEAESVLYPWRDANDETRSSYLAAVANLLGVEPRVDVPPDVLQRMAAAAASARDVAAAQQFGWYARAFNQFETAGKWFTTALSWNPDDEPSAYGLALTYQQLGNAAALAELKRIWRGRSERILAVGERTRGQPAGGAPTSVAAETPAAPPSAQSVAAETAPVLAAPRNNALSESTAAPGTASRPHGCAGTIHPSTLSAQGALDRGWCLMDANRPLEAADAFERALATTDGQARSDAAYGQSLAYLRAGLVDDAAVAAAKAPQQRRRVAELQSSILAERALGAFENGRYVEALIALDQRAQIAPERIDLMVLRGYAYLNLNRREDARRIFEAAAGTGSRDALKGLAAVNENASQR